jgi:serine/threonine-protein kinase
MVASYTATNDSFVAGKPGLWSNRRLFNTGFVQNFHVAPDGKRFAVLMSETEPLVTQRHATLVLDFFEEVRRRVEAAAR